MLPAVVSAAKGLYQAAAAHAEARRLEVRVSQVAFSDCLEYVQGSTIASCARQVTRRR